MFGRTQSAVVWIGLTSLLLASLSAQSSNRRSAWDEWVARDPGVVDDAGVGWRERLILQVLTPEQARAWRQGATEESLRLATGDTLQEYLNARLSPPAGVYVALPSPCRLFASTQVETGPVYGIRVRGDDLTLQGGNAAGCGVPSEATAVMVRVQVTAQADGSRVKLWSGDGPEPAESVIEVGDSGSTRDTVVVALARTGTAESDLLLRAGSTTAVAGEVVGYFRALGIGDVPNGGIAFYTEGASNNYFGDGAGAADGGSDNSFFGANTGNANTGSGNSFFGSSAGTSNVGGSANAFFGFEAGMSNIAGGNSAYFGAGAGRSSTGGNNAFFGGGAGYSNTTGFRNAFFGYEAGYDNLSGKWNSFFGGNAGRSNTTGQENTFFGDQAGLLNLTGSGNAFFGNSAGAFTTEGSNNLILGNLAGLSNTVESGNSYLGAFANGATGITNATALGYQAKVSQSNSLVLGSVAGVNGATASVNVGIGTPSPQRQFHVKGNNAVFRMDRDVDTASFLLVRTSAAGAPLKTFVVGTNAAGVNNGEFIINDLGNAVGGGGARRMTITNDGETHFTGTVRAPAFVQTSSLRYKNQVETLRDALETVDRLRGVSFAWKDTGKPSVGLIAEEVVEVLPEVVEREAGSGEVSGVNYAALVAVLVEAIKTQQERMKAQQIALTSLRAELAAVKSLESRLSALEELSAPKRERRSPVRTAGAAVAVSPTD